MVFIVLLELEDPERVVLSRLSRPLRARNQRKPLGSSRQMSSLTYSRHFHRGLHSNEHPAEPP